MRFATAAIHAADDPQDALGASVRPIYQSTTYRWRSLAEEPPFMYSRYGNPNRQALERTLAVLENAAHGVCFASGMAAVGAALSLARAGNHVLVASDIYGGTFNLSQRILPRQSVSVSFFDSLDPESLAREARNNTVLAIFESPTNPMLRICDVEALATEARKLGIRTVFDNTFATPCLMRPLDLGVDVVVHSTTKYLGGHSDVTGGAVLTNDADIHSHMLEHAMTVGGVPEPFSSWLTLRGVKTLPARMRVHCENAMAVAEFLSSHPAVERVHYPGLPGHEGHALAGRQMNGRFGGMVSFELRGGKDEVFRFAERTRVFHIAASLGGVESLLSYPPVFSHAGMTEEQRASRGIKPNLLRASVGLEDSEDLIEDLDQALGQ